MTLPYREAGTIGARPATGPERDPLRTMTSILNMVRIPPRPKGESK